MIPFIDLDEGYVLCLDPKCNSENAFQLTDYYLNILKKQFSNVNWHEQIVDQDIQHDAWNCGVFVIQFAERFIKSKNYTNL
ncbi:hypothetical protein FF38_10615 [Lucilia cuprina]|uniref:Ubiquitin-like protease family profile domain-containing protein n=1 Tax=Lucilia cuprina TaxID=7375 RepID=A0A0L0BX33_LUCCU|nr:hypothetical protein FF38_10615 [Lucilia cuprina]